MKRLCTSIIAAAALTALVVPTSQAMLERLLPSKNVHARIAKASKVVLKKGTKPASVIGSSCGATWSYCDHTASASPSDAVQPGPASIGSVDGQLSACWGLTCDAEYLSPVNDASAASNASPPNPPSPTYNDGAGT
jgi:hypothetical protein